MNEETTEKAAEAATDAVEAVTGNVSDTLSHVSQSLSDTLGFSLGNFSLATLISAAITFVICYVAIRMIRRILNPIIDRMNVMEGFRRFLKKALKLLLDFILILIVADCIGIPVTSLLAVFSLLGLAISLSVQSSLSNLASGIMILLSHPFDIGDFIESSVSGTVKEIGLIYTHILTIDNKLIYVPNKDISASNIINYSKEENRRVDLTFCAEYEDDIDTVKKALAEAVESVPKTLSDPAPFIRVCEYGASSINYTVRVWCKNEDYWDVYFDLLEAVPKFYEKYGVSMAYDHLDVNILHTPDAPKE